MELAFCMFTIVYIAEGIYAFSASSYILHFYNADGIYAFVEALIFCMFAMQNKYTHLVRALKFCILFSAGYMQFFFICSGNI